MNKSKDRKPNIRDVLNFNEYFFIDSKDKDTLKEDNTSTLNSISKENNEDPLLLTHSHLKGFTRDISRRCYFKDIGNGKQLIFTDAMIHTNITTPIICNVPQLPPLSYR